MDASECSVFLMPAWGTESDPRTQVREENHLQCCPLTSMFTLWLACSKHSTHTVQMNKYVLKNKRKRWNEFSIFAWWLSPLVSFLVIQTPTVVLLGEGKDFLKLNLLRGQLLIHRILFKDIMRYWYLPFSFLFINLEITATWWCFPPKRCFNGKPPKWC